MILQSPFIITARLMPGVHIGGAYISLDLGGRSSDNRTVYSVFIDLPDGTEHEIKDLRSGCGGGSVQDGFESLLSFLGAAAESYQYRMRTGQQGENEDLFPPAVVAWASENADEISCLEYDLQEGEFIS